MSVERDLCGGSLEGAKGKLRKKNRQRNKVKN